MKNLFVGNMSFHTTEAELNDLFKPFGQVTRVHLVMDRETGRARGFAFVEMPNDDEAAKAIAGLDGKNWADATSRSTKRVQKQLGAVVRAPAVVVVAAVAAGNDSRTRLSRSDAPAARTSLVVASGGFRQCAAA